MMESQIEAMLASPPERDEMVVQFFVKNGGQWGELYREDGQYWIDLYFEGSSTVRYSVSGFLNAVSNAQKTLQDRLEY